jgi:riboflavin biosynthesis pyrimidine reductase
VPLIVISKSGEIPESVRSNPLVHIWDQDSVSAVARAQSEFGPNVLVEGGINLLKELLLANVIDELYLTISSKSGGENIYDLSAMTREFTVESSEKSGGQTFLKLIKN